MDMGKGPFAKRCSHVPYTIRSRVSRKKWIHGGRRAAAIRFANAWQNAFDFAKHWQTA
jgi:hypothetical protein